MLVAYCSRAGENYWYGGRRDLEVGNTEVVARMIAELVECDVHRIEAVDPYPEGYDATVARNAREQDDDARPAIADPLDGVGGHGIVLLGSPIWNVRPPMIMQTFVEGLDLTGTRVLPSPTPSAAWAPPPGSTPRPAPVPTSARAWRCGARSPRRPPAGRGVAARRRPAHHLNAGPSWRDHR